MKVLLRDPQIGMPVLLRDLEERRARIGEVCVVGVSEYVHAPRLGELGALLCTADPDAEHLRRDLSALVVEQNAPGTPAPDERPKGCHQACGRGDGLDLLSLGQRLDHPARALPLPVDVAADRERARREVHVLDVEGEDLATAEPGVASEQDRDVRAEVLLDRTGEELLVDLLVVARRLLGLDARASVIE